MDSADQLHVLQLKSEAQPKHRLQKLKRGILTLSIASLIALAIAVVVFAIIPPGNSDQTSTINGGIQMNLNSSKAVVCPANATAAALRVDCGNALTTSVTCATSGCCWNALPAGTAGPYCYKVSVLNSVCPAVQVAAALRVDCGNALTTTDSCTTLGCCWNALPAGTAGPYCYKVSVLNSTCPAISLPAAGRVDCGNGLTTAQSCTTSGCCWSPLPAGTTGSYCYDPSKISPGYGTPGSDPGITLPSTVTNPGTFAVIANSPISPLGSAPMPNSDELIFIERVNNGMAGTTHTYAFNTNTLQFRTLHILTDVFCAGGAHMSDGRFLTTAGYTGNALQSVRIIANGGDWKENPSLLALQRTRWYPSVILLPDGRFWVIGGTTDVQPPGVNNPTVEMLPSSGAPIYLSILDQVQTQLYAFANIIPADANRATPSIFIFAGSQSQLLDIYTLATLATLPLLPGGGKRNYPYYGSSVMLPLKMDANNNPSAAEFLVCGGGTAFDINAPALNTCGRTTPSLGAAAVWVMETMPSARVMPDILTLPDGTVLIINGATFGSGGFSVARSPIHTAVLYNPQNAVGQRFSALASTPLERLYHSEAVLGIDGRVFVTGSGPNVDSNTANTQVIHPTQTLIEAYSPPYLSNGRVRPSINVTPTSWAYAQLLTIVATIPSGNASLTTIRLLAPVFATHGAQMGNSHLVLRVVSSVANGNNGFTFTVQAPRDAYVAQPRYYMLWVVDDGTPSLGKWIQLGGVPAAVQGWPVGF